VTRWQPSLRAFLAIRALGLLLPSFEHLLHHLQPVADEGLLGEEYLRLQIDVPDVLKLARKRQDANQDVELDRVSAQELVLD